MPVMIGLWNVETRGLSPGIPLLSWDAIVTTVAIFMTVTAIVKRHPAWEALKTLHTAMALLSFYFFLHWLDLVNRQVNKKLTYGYIIFEATVELIRVLSELSTLIGLTLQLYRFNHRQPPSLSDPHVPLVIVIIAVLIYLGLYHIGLHFGVCFSWLGFANVWVIDLLAKNRNGFEIAYCTLAFVIVMWLMLKAPGELEQSIYQTVNRVDKQCLAMGGLFLRAFSEIVIVGQLDRYPKHLTTVLRARDVTYGLFSLVFLVFIPFVTPAKSEGEDPLQVEVDSLEALRRQEAESFEKFLETTMKKRLDDMTDAGRRTAPAGAIFTILNEIEATLPQTNPTNQVSREEKLAELARLRRVYEGWEPICKAWHENPHDY